MTEARPLFSANRRSFLSAASFAVVTAVATKPEVTLAAPQSAEWNKAHATYLAATKALGDFDRDFYTPACDRWEAWRGQWPNNARIENHPDMLAEVAFEEALFDPVEERFDELVGARTDALLGLISTPAPHHHAIAVKVEVMMEDDMWEREFFGDQMAHLQADLKRLSGDAA